MEKALTLKYTCKDCGFTWITLNGEHSICPKCHSENIEFLEEVKDLDIKRRMLRFCKRKRSFNLR